MVTGAPDEPEGAVVAVASVPELEAVVAVGSVPELEAVVAVGSEPVEPVAGVGVSVAPPHAESSMARTTIKGSTRRVNWLVAFIAVMFLLWKQNRYSSLVRGETHLCSGTSRRYKSRYLPPPSTDCLLPAR